MVGLLTVNTAPYFGAKRTVFWFRKIQFLNFTAPYSGDLYIFTIYLR